MPVETSGPASGEDLGPRWLEARSAISELRAAYTFAVDQGDVDALVATFTDDGAFRTGSLAHEGHAALRQFFTEITASPSVYHLVANEVLDRLEGRDAEGRAYVVVVDRQSKSIAMVGWYADRMTETADGWRFVERTLHPEV